MGQVPEIKLMMVYMDSTQIWTCHHERSIICYWPKRQMLYGWNGNRRLDITTCHRPAYCWVEWPGHHWEHWKNTCT